MDEKGAVSVKIYNDTYVLRTVADEQKVLRIAAEVDSRMQTLAAAKSGQSRDTLAVWAALDLAADLVELQRRYERLLAAVREGWEDEK